MTDTVEKKESPIWIKLWPVYVIAAGLALAVSQGWHQYLTLDSLSENAVWLDELVRNNLVLVLAGYILVYAAATTFIIPGGVLTIAGGFLFGLYIGTPATIIAATVGASILFFAAKTSIGSVLRQIGQQLSILRHQGFGGFRIQPNHQSIRCWELSITIFIAER